MSEVLAKQMSLALEKGMNVRSKCAPNFGRARGKLTEQMDKFTKRLQNECPNKVVTFHVNWDWVQRRMAAWTDAVCPTLIYQNAVRAWTRKMGVHRPTCTPVDNMEREGMTMCTKRVAEGLDGFGPKRRRWPTTSSSAC